VQEYASGGRSVTALLFSFIMLAQKFRGVAHVMDYLIQAVDAANRHKPKETSTTA
jgi:hypothetical protein